LRNVLLKTELRKL